MWCDVQYINTHSFIYIKFKAARQVVTYFSPFCCFWSIKRVFLIIHWQCFAAMISAKLHRHVSSAVSHNMRIVDSSRNWNEKCCKVVAVVVWPLLLKWGLGWKMLGDISYIKLLYNPRVNKVFTFWFTWRSIEMVLNIEQGTKRQFSLVYVVVCFFFWFIFFKPV